MNHSLLRRARFLVVGISFVALAQGPSKPSRLAFEVASIRPSEPGQTRGGIKAIPSGRGYTAHNIQVRLMMAVMYRMPLRQITGGPEWIDSQPWDVEARADGAYNLDELHTMYKNLLTDRFGLKFHTETRTGNIYAMTLDPGGLKMKPNSTPDDFAVPLGGGAGHITGTRVSMKYLCWWLSGVLDEDERPIVNMTGLDGNYDFTLNFNPQIHPGPTTPNGADEELPNIFTALREQLGLRLTPQKGPADYFVIDAVQKPTEN